MSITREDNMKKIRTALNQEDNNIDINSRVAALWAGFTWKELDIISLPADDGTAWEDHL